jgi:hypothetical protein
MKRSPDDYLTIALICLWLFTLGLVAVVLGIIWL